MVQGHHGIQFAKVKPGYTTYKSPFGPNYKIGMNIRGIGLNRALKFGTTAAGFGIVAGVFAVQFLSEIPKMREDVMQKLPFIGDYYIREVPSSDNPF